MSACRDFYKFCFYCSATHRTLQVSQAKPVNKLCRGSHAVISVHGWLTVHKLPIGSVSFEFFTPIPVPLWLGIGRRTWIVCKGKYKTSTTYPLYETTQCFVLIKLTLLSTIRLTHNLPLTTIRVWLNWLVEGNLNWNYRQFLPSNF